MKASRASRPIGWRARPLAFAAVALLAGCATAGRDAASVVAFAEAGRDGTRMIAFPQATTPGRSTAVLFRVEPGAGALPASGSAGLWRLDQGEPSGSSAEMLRAPSQVAWEQGWRVLPHLSAGRYILRIGTSDPGAVPPLDLTLRIPPNPPPVTYIGSFRVVCAAPVQSCRIMAGAAEPAEAAALVALTGPALAPPVTALAGPYPPSLGALGLARPTAPRIRVDPRLWVAAIDWNAVIREGGGQVPPALGPQSRIEGGGETEMVLTSSVPGAIGGTIGGAGNAGGAAGAVVVLGALAIVGTVALIALIAQAIAKDQRNRKDAAEARREAERLQAAAQAEAQASPCLAAIAATLAPEAVERDLQAAFAPSRATARRAELPGPWEATVTRVVLRRCAGGPDHHGVEVATRWTATRPGEAEPAFDAAYTRSVRGAVPDTRLVHSTRPPWELPVATEADCRPLADYCAGGGTGLLRADVARGVSEARDAVLAAR